MSKKLIAILMVATIVFVCGFASCKKEENVYTNEKEFQFVTDENGEKVYGEDGQLIVYVTDEDGKAVTNADGEKETVYQQFQPLESDGVIEDFGFKLAIPEGWSAVESQFGVFENKKKEQTCEISVVRYLYADYYELNKTYYKELSKNKVEVNWEDEVDLGESFEKMCRFTMEKDGSISVLYFFENSGNVYKILFVGTDSDSFITETEDFCKAISFKGVTYYNDVTAMSEESK